MYPAPVVVATFEKVLVGNNGGSWKRKRFLRTNVCEQSFPNKVA